MICPFCFALIDYVDVSSETVWLIVFSIKKNLELHSRVKLQQEGCLLAGCCLCWYSWSPDLLMDAAINTNEKQDIFWTFDHLQMGLFPIPEPFEAWQNSDSIIQIVINDLTPGFNKSSATSAQIGPSGSRCCLSSCVARSHASPAKVKVEDWINQKHQQMKTIVCFYLAQRQKCFTLFLTWKQTHGRTVGGIKGSKL